MYKKLIKKHFTTFLNSKFINLCRVFENIEKESSNIKKKEIYKDYLKNFIKIEENELSLETKDKNNKVI